MKPTSPSWQLALVPAATTLLLAAAVLLLSDWLLARHLAARADARVEQAADHLATLMSRALNRRVGEVQLLARSERLRPEDPTAPNRAELEWLQAQTGGYAWIGLTDASGTVVAATGGLLEGRSIAQRPVFLQGAQALWVGDVHPSVALAPLLAKPGQPAPDLLDIAIPLHDAVGKLRGVITVHLSWPWFAALRDEVLGNPREDGLRIVILTAAGQPLVSELPDGADAALLAALAAPRAAGQPLAFEIDGVRQVAARREAPAVREVEALGWQIVAVQDLDVALAPLTALQRSLVVGGLLLAAGFGALGYLLSQRLSRPYAGLLEAATQRFAADPAPRAQGLTRYLDALSEQLRALPPPAVAGAPLSSEALLGLVLRDADRLQRMLDQLPAAVYLLGGDYRVLYWNRACETMFGWSRDEALGRDSAELLPATTRSVQRAALRRRIADEPGPFEFASEVRHRDGRPVHGEWRVSKLYGDDGAFLGVLAQVRDTTAEHAARAETSALEGRLQILTDAAVDYAFVLLDAAGRIRGGSAGAERLTGCPAADLLGCDHAELFADTERTAGLPAALRREADLHGRAEFEGWSLRRDGSRYWSNLLLYRLGEAGSGYAQVTRDLSASRATEMKLRENEATLAAVIHGASDAVISTDIDGRITLFNPAAERIFGHPAETLLGQRLERLLPPGHRGHHDADLARFAASRVSRRAMGAGRVQGLRADGSTLELEASISQVTINERQVLTAILRDVTERVRADNALLQSRRELSELTQQLMAQEKITTRRLAQALHDQLGQTLAAIRLGFDAAPPGRSAAEHERLDRLIDQAIREVRQVLVDLRPPLLDELGLAAALDNELGTRRPAHPDTDLLLDVPPALAGQRWAPDVEYAAFMVAREAVGNALRHARAATVRVELAGGPQALRLEVSDDGLGLPPGAAAGRPGHLGMVGMRERAAAIGARFELQSPPGEGSVVVLNWEETSG